jgi:hypothetical protein
MNELIKYIYPKIVARSQRRIINKHSTGVVSRSRMRDVKRADLTTYGLKSSMCSEDDLANKNEHDYIL